MAPANASGKSASDAESAAAEEGPDGRTDAARASNRMRNDDHDESCGGGGGGGGGGEDAAQHTCASSSSSSSGAARRANACDDQDVRNATSDAGSNVSAADSSEGEEKKEEMGVDAASASAASAASAADGTNTAATAASRAACAAPGAATATARNDDAGSEDDGGGPARAKGSAGRKKGACVHEDIIDKERDADCGHTEEQVTTGEDEGDSRKALAVDLALVRRAEEAEDLALVRRDADGRRDAAARAHAAADGGDAAATAAADDSSRGGSVAAATWMTASSSAAVAMGMAAASARTPVASNVANTTTTNNTSRSRFSRGLGPGAYHVIPRRNGNGNGNDSPSDATARTDVAEVTTIGDTSIGDIQQPVQHGFFAPSGTSSRRSSFNAGNSSRRSSFSADPQQAGRRASLASIESVPGAHAIPGINNFDGSASDQHPIAATGSGSGSLSGRTEIDVTATAYLVEERDALEDLPSAELVDPDEFKGPEPEPFHRRREGRVTMVVVGLLLLAVAAVLGVFYTNSSGGSQVAGTAGGVPTASPTQAPTFDPRPTLQVVQDRGTVRCGVENVAAGEVRFGQYTADLCRRLAAAVLGDPSRIRLVPVDDNNRYGRLSDREVDVMYAGDSFTLEKLVREVGTTCMCACLCFVGVLTRVNDTHMY